jgi:hypothetical protein
VGKPEGKRPLGRPRRRWGDGVRMDLREIGYGSVERIFVRNKVAYIKINNFSTILTNII